MEEGKGHERVRGKGKKDGGMEVGQGLGRERQAWEIESGLGEG